MQAQKNKEHIKNKLILIEKIILSLLAPYIYIFFILNIPSLKLIHSSFLINLGTLIGLFIAGYRKKKISKTNKLYINSSQKIFIVIWFVFWLILFLSGFFGRSDVLSITLFLRYLTVFFMVIGTVVFISAMDIKKIIILQIVWGTLLSLIQLSVGIDLNPDLGQNYLTLGLPIASSLLAAIGLLMWNQVSAQAILLLFIILLNALALSTLPGRSPILFPAIISITYFVLFLFFSSSQLKKINGYKVIKEIIFFSLTFLITSVVIINNLSSFWLQRFSQLLLSPEDEARLDLYRPAIDAIINNPFGYGLNSSENIIGFYPHNIFLEVFMSGGILAVLFLLFILLLFLYSLFKKSLLKEPYLFIFSMIATYFFGVWNISFDLGSSYIPFTAISALLSLARTNK